jgi:hypothetical protein
VIQQVYKTKTEVEATAAFTFFDARLSVSKTMLVVGTHSLRHRNSWERNQAVFSLCRTTLTLLISTICFTYPLVAPRGGPTPEIVVSTGCFPDGPDPPIPLLSISEWIKSRGPSIAFVNQTFLLTLNLDKGTHTLEHFGRSKVVKGQAPQNILGML